MTWILIVATMTLAASFVCSMIEATLYSLNPAQLEVMQRDNVIGARRFARYREHVEQPIAAILAVNTIANTFGSSVCGALVSDRFGSGAIGVFAGVFTLIVLLSAEILPKSLGVRYAQRLVPFLAGPLQFLMWVSWPIARPAHKMMTRLTGGAKPSGPTEEEVIALSRMAWRSGSLSAGEMRWVENALRLDTVSAWDLMTPRSVVQSIGLERKVDDVVRELATLRHSRLPLFEADNPDRIDGFVLRRDIIDSFAAGHGDRLLRELARPLAFVPDTMKGPQLLQKLIRDKIHIVAVTDEYGGFEGIVTLEDVLEHLLGQEIVDEHDEHVDMQELARRRAHGRMGPQSGRDRAPPPAAVDKHQPR